MLTNTLNNVTKSYSYTYDKNGNIKSEIVVTSSQGEQGETVETTKTTHYTYDSKKQLVASENGSVRYTYSYDSRGNILSKKEYTVTLDGNNEKVYTETESDSYTYDETWKDKLTSYNGQTITYDASGNPLNYMGHNLSWTMGRQLASFDGIAYTYNETGIRTSKTVDNVTTTYYLDKTNIIEQITGNAVFHFYYDSGNELIGFNYADNDYIYVKNQQGDVTDITNSGGQVVASYTYDPWGKITSISGSNLEIANLNPFRYRSYYYDSDIQMYYLQSRYYDPEVGRFINCDDVHYIGTTQTELSYNAFAYCGNDPVNCSDPSGTIAMSTCIIIGVVAGAVIGGTIGGVISYKKYKSVRWKYIFIGAVAGAAIGGAAGYAIGIAIGASATTASTAKAFSGCFKITKKISKQMSKRGWTNDLIKSTIRKNVGRKALNKATGNVATAYFTSSGAYVVIDNVTKEIVQLSNINDPNWVVDATIKLLKKDVFIK